jgi:tyrosyl-tRNA synthetase
MGLLVLSGLCASRSDARRNIQQGGVLCGDDKVTDISLTFSADQLRDGIVLRRGKKNYKKVVLK